MNSSFILESIHKKYPSAAIVPELSIEDMFLEDSDTVGRTHNRSYSNTPTEYKYMRRIDALMFESLVRTAIEVKVTKEDFYRDSYWKRRAWRDVTHRFIYAVPHYLDVKTSHGVGLWKVGEDGTIEVAKKAILNKTPNPLPQTTIQRMAYRISNERFKR